MEIGAVTEILKDVIARRIARQTDPVRAFATHMCVAGGTALHRQHQAVTADAGECAAALGNVGRAVVRTAGTEMRWAFGRSEEHTSELQSLMRISYAVFCLKKKKQKVIIRTK